jgi:hypothetical protein
MKDFGKKKRREKMRRGGSRKIRAKDGERKKAAQIKDSQETIVNNTPQALGKALARVEWALPVELVKNTLLLKNFVRSMMYSWHHALAQQPWR